MHADLLHPQRLEQLVDFAAAVGERIERQPTLSSKVRCRLASGVGWAKRMWRPPSHAAGGAAGDKDGEIVVVVDIGVAHAAAVEMEAMIEEGAVGFRRGAQLGEELGEE